MAKTYQQLQQQIQTLQTAADKARRKELDGVIARIREAIAFYNLTEADLGFGGRRGRKPGPKGKAAAAAEAPKKKRGPKAAARKPSTREVQFADGAGGTWGGRGKRPQWLRDAINAGRSLEEFRVKSG